jgi:hypothetical protein
MKIIPSVYTSEKSPMYKCSTPSFSPQKGSDSTSLNRAVKAETIGYIHSIYICSHCMQKKAKETKQGEGNNELTVADSIHKLS